MGCTTSQNVRTEIQYGTFVGGEASGGTRVLRNVRYSDNLESAPEEGVNTMFDAMGRAFEQFAQKPMLGTREGEQYHWKTFGDVKELATRFGSAVVGLGLAPKEQYEGRDFSFFGIYAKNREEWIVADVASSMFGLCIVPFYDTLGADAMTFILQETGLSTILLAKAGLSALLSLRAKGQTAQLCSVVLMDRTSAEEKSDCEHAGLRFYDYTELLAYGKENPQEYRPPSPDNVHTICYTSGTTGNPKGVMLTHRNLVSNIAGALHIFTPTPADVHISYLPLSHIYERVVISSIFYSGARAGFYAGDILKLKEDLAVLRPTVLACVPRLLNRFYDVIQNQFSGLRGSKAKLVAKAVRAKLGNLQQSGKTTHGFYDKLVFKKVKKVLGGRVRISVTASAPIAAEVLNFLKITFCCPIVEAYGQTEAGGASTCTENRDADTGHVGGPLSSVEIKLIDIPDMNYTSQDRDGHNNEMARGEICFRGPSVFIGYFKQPEQTRETLDSEGWLHSGDVGQLLHNNSLKIIDRKKNIFKLAQGEYIAPEKIENIYIKSKYIALIFVHGDSLQSYLVAIVVPDREICEAWAREKKLEIDWEDLCQNEELKNTLLEDLDSIGKGSGLHGFEQVKKIHLHPEVLTPEGTLLTPTFKIKRHEARTYFRERIEHLYSS